MTSVKKLKRREFSSFTSLFVLGSLVGVKPLFKANFSIPLSRFESEADFFKSQSKHENTRMIELLNSSFKAQGKLLKFNFFKENDSLVWEYHFDSKASFHEWESELYRQGFVNNAGRSIVPTRQFSYTLLRPTSLV